MATLLLSIPDAALVTDYGRWIVEQDEEIGLKVNEMQRHKYSLSLSLAWLSFTKTAAFVLNLLDLYAWGLEESCHVRFSHSFD